MANIKGKYFFQVLCVVEGIQMEWILKKNGRRIWAGLIWLRAAMSTEVILLSPITI